MKLIEVVILTGMQCISPVQHKEIATEATKVWCAVVVEKDTVAGLTKVTPPSEADHPAVKLVLQRFETIGKPSSGSTQLSVEPEPALTEQRPSMLVPDAPEPAGRVEMQAEAETPVPRPIPRPAVAETENAAAPEAQIETPAAADEVATPEPAASKPATKPRKKNLKKTKAKKQPGRCSGAGKQVWYTNKDGIRKYRCRRSLY